MEEPVFPVDVPTAQGLSRAGGVDQVVRPEVERFRLAAVEVEVARPASRPESTLHSLHGTVQQT